jgi:hypothetical protein
MKILSVFLQIIRLGAQRKTYCYGNISQAVASSL